MSRNHKNWLDAYLSWCIPRSEATELYILWSGLFTLASVLKRKIYIPKEFMGSYEIYPNLYVMFVGEAGGPRKTTTVSYTEDLLDETPNIHRSTAALSEEQLMNKLAKSPDGSIMIRSTEFSSLYKTSREKMIEFLVDVYDGKKNHDYETLTRGLDHADKPCINLIAGTTPVWIAENLSEAAIGGGFASRCIFLYEKDVRTRQLYYKHLNHKELGATRDTLIQDLHHIEKTIAGPFSIDEESMKFMEPWYREMMKKGVDDKRLTGYLNRKHVHVHKVAMLLHVARSDNLELRIEDFEEAIKIFDEVEENLLETFAALGKNPYTVEMDNIRDFIISRGKVTKKEILYHFRQAAVPAMVEELLQGLVEMGEIELYGGDPSRPDSGYYRPIVRITTEQRLKQIQNGGMT